jgi:HK97 family phage major capsid protein
MRLWGVPIAETDAITANTALTGDFTNFSQLWMRQGVEVQIGYVNTTFIEGKQVIRVTLRAALCTYRAAAFCTVTGLPQ